jgi:hypothetical protein
MKIIMTVTDWLEITITFNAKCNECGKDVLPGKAMWSRSAKAARHLSCSKIGNQTKTPSPMVQNIMETAFELIRQDSAVAELKCFICGMKTGCNECEYLTECEQRTYSKYCICKECSIKQEEVSFHNYKQSFAAKTMKYLK